MSLAVDIDLVSRARLRQNQSERVTYPGDA